MTPAEHGRRAGFRVRWSSRELTCEPRSSALPATRWPSLNCVGSGTRAASPPRPPRSDPTGSRKPSGAKPASEPPCPWFRRSQTPAKLEGPVHRPASHLTPPDRVQGARNTPHCDDPPEGLDSLTPVTPMVTVCHSERTQHHTVQGGGPWGASESPATACPVSPCPVQAQVLISRGNAS